MSIMRRILVTLLALLFFAAAGAGAYLVVDDQRGSTAIRSEVSVRAPGGGTVALSALTRDQARELVRTRVAAPLLEPMSVRLPEGALPNLDPVDPEWVGIVTIDTERLLADAFGAQERMPLAQRVWRQVTGRPVSLELDAKKYVSVDETKTREWVRLAAAANDRPARNAVRQVTDGQLTILPSEAGVEVDQLGANSAIASALVGVNRAITLPAYSLEPTLTEESFDRTIVVDVSERKLYLYAMNRLDRTYRVAVGTPGFPTPKGEFQIVLKRYRPTWVNPGSDWAVDMPPFIPPGPGNPLGTRALNLSVPGIRIHGTEKVDSIGTAASHGCVRMLRRDIEELYDLVDVGTAVFIVR